jgi:hypothetical protein
MNENDIPGGWIPLSSYDKRADGGPRGEYDLLIKAVNKGSVLDSMSLGRPKKWYVKREQAERFLSEHARGKSQGDSETEVMRMLAEIHDTLRSLVDSLK